jgi:hypothetical protein
LPFRSHNLEDFFLLFKTAQQAPWFHHLFSLEISAYNCFCKFHLKHRQSFFVLSQFIFGDYAFYNLFAVTLFFVAALKHFTCGADLNAFFGSE